MLQALRDGRAGKARWFFEPHVLFALPLGALAVASLRATSPLSAMRLACTALLAVLCLVSIVCGISRTREQLIADSPNRTSEIGLLELGSIGVTRRQSVAISQSALLDESQLTKRALLRTPTHETQYQATAVLGTIALAALGVTAFLVAGQIQRSGPITPFGLTLGCLLCVIPAALALHLALSRTDVEFTPQYVRVSCKRGLLGTAVMQWSMAEVRAIRLESAASRLAIDLVVQVNDQDWTIVLRGRAQQAAHHWFELGSSKS